MCNDFIVRSRQNDYSVKFSENIFCDLNEMLSDKDHCIIDENIYRIYAKTGGSVFDRDKIIKVASGEESKTLTGCSEVIESLLRHNIRKNSRIIAIGGGVIQDISGFISTVLFRGIEWIFVPTTLLAQADSCIGSKTSINFKKYKNLLGSFYPPREILINTKFLASLSENDIRSGIGEMMHYFFIDGNTSVIQGMMNEYEQILSSPDIIGNYIFESLKIKKDVIERDELDKGERNLFNYGHTFGHAIEAFSCYAVNHGQAVTMGMDIANYLSLQLSYIDASVYEQMRSMLIKNMPDFQLGRGDIEEYFKFLSKDKKNIADNLGCILTKGPGCMLKQQLPMDAKLKDIIGSYFSRNINK